MKHFLIYAALAASVAIAALVAYINVEALSTAFGEGPPYYGRTTNMDKWTNPIPMLLALDALLAAALVPTGFWIRRQVRVASGSRPTGTCT